MSKPINIPDKAFIKKLVFDIQDVFNSRAPVFDSSWASSIPENLLDLLRTSKLLYLIQGKEYATDIECLIYLYTRSLVAPMGSELTKIYLYLGYRVNQQWSKKTLPWPFDGPMSLVTEIEEDLENKLMQLRIEIYELRRKKLQ